MKNTVLKLQFSFLGSNFQDYKIKDLAQNIGRTPSKMRKLLLHEHNEFLSLGFFFLTSRCTVFFLYLLRNLLRLLLFGILTACPTFTKTKECISQRIFYRNRNCPSKDKRDSKMTGKQRTTFVFWNVRNIYSKKEKEMKVSSKLCK